jgi:tetratricopeptide (TPR) repeat protein
VAARKQRDYLLVLSPVLILVVIGWLAAWSNHFESSFHFDDFPTIVANESIQHLSNVPRFFTNPRISSAEQDSADYRPLLSSWFAFDYWLSGPKPFTFQLENWLWFIAALVAMFLLFRVIPGVNNFAAAFATLLFGLHPVTADTVNYALRRGVIMQLFAVTGGLWIFICWPWRLPQKLPIRLKRVPQHGLDEYLRNNFQRLDALYLKIIHFPAGLYLWPVIPALLAEPATAVFAPILLVYILLFETKRTPRHAIPAAIACIGYWIFQLVFSWKLREFTGVPAANYWFTQPWVAMRYLGKFFVPVHLSVDTGFGAFAQFWDPLAIAGYVGIAVLLALAVVTARVRQWRAVSFGIWWYLLALLPDAIVPQRAVEADWRMFVPFAGLAFACAATASIAVESLAPESTDQSRRRVPLAIAAVLAFGILAVLGWSTYQRSAVWESEATLWRNAMEASPRNGRAFMHYGLTRLAAGDSADGFDYLRRAATAAPHDPAIGISLANAYERLSQSSQAEIQFRRAMSDGPSWSPAYSAFSQWLLARTRLPEASAMATRALALDPYDLVARRTLMDVMADGHQWARLKQFAVETLRLLPDDPDGQRSLEVAQTGLDQVAKAETMARTEPTVDNYLALSADYYQAQRYEDSIKAARAALRINPNQAEAYANLASAYHSLGNVDETIAALQQEVRLNPNLPSAKSNLAIELAVKAKSTQPTSGPNKQ